MHTPGQNQAQASGTEGALAPKPRLPWVDHLRTLMILLVVNVHACVTYSHVGGWYVMSEREPSLAAKVPFIIWEAHLQSFFMGFLFFLAGYFAHGSLERRGPAGFVRERLFRLGLPTLLYMLVIHPFILLGLNPWHAEFPPVAGFYGDFLRSGRFLSASGPLWFTFALTLFCLALAGWRALRPRCFERAAAHPPGPGGAPSPGKIWGLAFTVGCISFLVRLVQPLGTNILNMQLCFFAQYIAAFALGLTAARHGWLLPLASSARARRAGWFALAGGPLALLALMLAGAKDGVTAFAGGWHWQALGYALWEQFTGVGLSLGLLWLFSTKLDGDQPALRWLADRSFAVYVLHAPILVALMMLYRRLPQHPYLLAALLTATGLTLSYGAADLARRVPGLRAIL